MAYGWFALVDSFIVSSFKRCPFDRPNATEICFALDDWWFYGPTCGAFAAVSSKLFIELARVQDRIHMSKEISSAAIAWLVTAGKIVEWAQFYLL